MANDIQPTAKYTTKSIDKVFKARQKSAALNPSKPRFRKKRVK